MTRLVFVSILGCFIVSGAFSPTAAAPTFKNLVKNPGFEESADAHPDYWEKSEGYGPSELTLSGDAYEGKSAISLRGSGEWSSRIEGVRPSTYYLLSFWVYRDGWKDEEYPTVKIFQQEIYQDELFGWGNWVRVSYLVHSGRFRNTVLSFKGNGLSDSIKFDNARLEEFRILPAGPESGAKAVDSRTEFSWTIPEDGRVYNISLHLADNKEFRHKKILSMHSPLGNQIALKKPLAEGTWYWRLYVYHNRLKLDASEIRSFSVEKGEREKPKKGPSKRLARLSKRKAKQKPFFPIGIYSAPIEALPDLKRAGFNLVQNYRTDPEFSSRFIKEATANGLKAMPSLFPTEKSADLESLLTRFKDDPGLFGWYIADEPEGRGISPSRLWKWSRFIHSHDENHPTSLVNLRSHKISDYGPAVNISIVDPYPVPHKPFTWLSDSIEESLRSLYHSKPVWASIQAFNWNSIGERFARGQGRFPTLREMRCLTYLAIVHGVQGVIYYSYEWARRNDAALANWNNVKKVVGELKGIYPVLLAPNKKERWFLETFSDSRMSFYQEERAARDANGEPAIHYAVKKIHPQAPLPDTPPGPGKGIYLIAVNVTPHPVHAVWRRPSLRGRSVKALFDDRQVKIDGHKLKDRFAPYAVHVYYIS